MKCYHGLVIRGFSLCKFNDWVWIGEMKRMNIEGRLKYFIRCTLKLAQLKRETISKKVPCTRENGRKRVSK
jgi:hypothetical protein